MSSASAEDKKERARLKGLIERIGALPAPPAVASRILSLALDENTDLKSMTSLVESEPSLALKVLKQAGTARHGRLESLSQAANVIGMAKLRGILLGVAVRECLAIDPKSNDPLLKTLWRHSLSVAVAAELIAEKLIPNKAPLAFAAGLLHDCGRLALFALEPERFVRLSERSGAAWRVLEEAEFGAEHSLAGKWLVERWGLPDTLRDAIWLHHQPLTALQAQAEKGFLPLLIRLCDALAHELVQDEGLPGSSALIRETAPALNLNPSGLDEIRAAIGQRFAERADVFDLENEAASYYFNCLQRASRKMSENWAVGEEARQCLQGAKELAASLLEFAPQLSQGAGVTEIAPAALAALSQGLEVRAAAFCLRDEHSGLLQICEQGRQSLRWHELKLSEPDLDKAWGLDSDLLTALGFGRMILSGAPQAQGFKVFSRFAPQAFSKPEVSGGIFALFASQPGELELKWLDLLGAMAAAALERHFKLESVHELAESLAHSNQVMQDLNAKLIRTERLAAVGQLAAGAAHEINNPLAIVYARVQLLELRESDEQKKKSMRQMMEQIERISSIMNNLMDFARPAPPRFEPVDLQAILRKCLSLTQGTSEKQGVESQFSAEASLPEVQGDPRQLEQVFLNLVLNALHAMEKSGGELTVSLNYLADSDSVSVKLKDSGCGIAQENLAKIFDPFFTTKEEGRGTGLGLSTSHAIIAAHHGEISVKSEPDQGTEVTVLLPRDWRGSSSFEPKPLSAKPTTGVLVVDDEPHIREILSEALKSRGFEVGLAPNGQEAMALIDKAKPALILLDIRMPKLGGLELMRELKARELKIPVLVLTGLAGPQEIEQAMALGAVGLVRKPFQIETLLDEVARQIEAAS